MLCLNPHKGLISLQIHALLSSMAILKDAANISNVKTMGIATKHTLYKSVSFRFPKYTSFIISPQILLGKLFKI